MIKCTNCGLINPENALKCDCGYNFDKKEIEAANLPFSINEYDEYKILIKSNALFSLFGLFLVITHLIALYEENSMEMILWLGIVLAIATAFYLIYPIGIKVKRGFIEVKYLFGNTETFESDVFRKINRKGFLHKRTTLRLKKRYYIFEYLNEK
jgi:hypothetical protein